MSEISKFREYINSVSPINISSFKSTDTVLVIVDVINGFVREGALASKRIENIIPEISLLISKFSEQNINILAFVDSHDENAIEFESFPVHCLKNTSESEIVDEIKNSDMTVIPKNSTNGFHAPLFKKILSENKQWKNFIVCGDCTDICVLNFCLSLKTYFNQINEKSRVIVPLNAVETYDGGIHDAEFMNLSALMIMKTNGIELVKRVE